MAEALKDRYFQLPFFDRLSLEISKVYPEFSKDEFYHKVFDESWSEKPLKEMLMHSASMLRKCLPDDYLLTLDILKRICHKFNDFDAMIFPDVVRQFGMDHYNESMEALELFTQYSTAEFAIRPFILKFEKQTMQQMLRWSKHKDEHVRRLSSEGCRPRLPWSMALPNFKKNPALVLPILENLKNDSSLYVRKSVANNWNDITKDNPELVTKVLAKWNEGAGKETFWIIRNALRGLLKEGHPDALKILGYEKVKIAISHFKLSSSSVAIGNKFNFSFTVKNENKELSNLMVDYVIYFNKSNGKSSPKVFKLKAVNIPPGRSIAISKSHDFRIINTRKYYPGEHTIQIQINGMKMNQLKFNLLP